MQSALLLIGVAVLMHVTWNLSARHVDARCNYLWWGLLAHLLLLGPVGVYGLLMDAHWSWSLLTATLITVCANSLYFIGLRHAYAKAPAAFVYPLARSSPLLIVLWTWLLFGEAPGLQAFVGISISVLGLWLLASTGNRQGGTGKALPWIALAAFCTSVYSICDKVAITDLPTIPAVFGYVSLGYTASFLLLTAFNKREFGTLVPPCRPPWRYLLPGGLCIGTSYVLVIYVMQYLPAAYVVAFTNTGIVLASVLSVVLLGERERWRQRLLAAAVIGAGLLVLGLGL